MDSFKDQPDKYRAQITIIGLLVQISFFILAHRISTNYFIKYNMFSGRDINWGLRVEYIFYEFVALFLVQCFLIYKFPQKTVLISLLTTLVVGLIVLPYYWTHPFRVLHIGLEGFICVWVHFVIRYFAHFHKRKVLN